MSIERTSDTWLTVKDAAEKDIVRLHSELEGDIAQEQTWKARGEIAALRRLIALGENTAPDIVPATDGYGL